MYDPAGQSKWAVGTADVVRSSARASRQPGGFATLSFRLTNNGAMKFHNLTRALARRGARLHRAQRFAFEVDGRVVSLPSIDYRAFPNGLDGRSGIQVEGLKFATAQRLARGIRQG
jgi:preprotein translocase subunit SecD